jgi:hypothetical protein
LVVLGGPRYTWCCTSHECSKWNDETYRRGTATARRGNLHIVQNPVTIICKDRRAEIGLRGAGCLYPNSSVL